MKLRNYALLVLVMACVHEFAWQFLPDGLGLQGNLRAVTQWPYLLAVLAGLAVLMQDRFMSAVCAAAAVMSSTTALCGAWWFAARWDLVPGVEHCSTKLGFPLLLLSAAVAVSVFWRWGDDRGQN